MSRKVILILGIILVILTIAGLGYWFSLTIASKEEAAGMAKTIQPVDKNILSDKNIKNFEGLEINGSFPLNAGGSSENKNPF